jgi:site-specific recombinase XerD
MPRTKSTSTNPRHAQVVFQMGKAGLAAGVDPKLEGAVFLCEPGRDRSQANSYLYALHLKEFSNRRRTQAPEWMGRSRKLKISLDSLLTEAGDLSRGCRWLEDHGYSILTVTEEQLDELGEDLERGDLEGGTIGAMQMSLIHCAQWAVWEGRREELDITWRPATGYDSVNILVVRKQRRGGLVDYIDPQTASAICDAIVDPVYRIAVQLLFRSGLRPSEPGAILDRDMPHRTKPSAISQTTFSVVGKGKKRRDPVIDNPLLEEVNRYRLLHRPKRAKMFEQRHGFASDHLLLNAKSGEPISYMGLYAVFSDACESLGIEARPHWARHAYACDHMANTVVERIKAAKAAGVGVNLDDVESLISAARFELMLLLGHSKLEISELYLTQVRRAVTRAFKSMGTADVQ